MGWTRGWWNHFAGSSIGQKTPITETMNDKFNKNEMHELSNLIEDTGAELAEEYYLGVQPFLDKLHLFDGDNDPPNPLEVWKGIIQAIADYSGCRVVLKAAILAPTPEDPKRSTIIGHRQIAAADPTVWIKEA